MKTLVVIMALDPRRTPDLAVEALRRVGYAGEVVVLTRRDEATSTALAASLAAADLAEVPEVAKQYAHAEAVLVIDALTLAQADPTPMIEEAGKSGKVYALVGPRYLANIADRVGLTADDRKHIGSRQELLANVLAFGRGDDVRQALKAWEDTMRANPHENANVSLCQALVANPDKFRPLDTQQFNGFRTYPGPLICFDTVANARQWLDGQPAQDPSKPPQPIDRSSMAKNELPKDADDSPAQAPGKGTKASGKRPKSDE